MFSHSLRDAHPANIITAVTVVGHSNRNRGSLHPYYEKLSRGTLGEDDEMDEKVASLDVEEIGGEITTEKETS